MLERGFRPLDAHGIGYRPHDYAFWQIELVFAPVNRKEFAYPGYR